jgi:hypothetical protein
MAITQENDKQERKFIDPLAADLATGEAMELDTDADAFERSAPPVAGRYDLHVTLARDAWEAMSTEQGDVFYRANLECKIVNAIDEEINGAVVFARLSTFIGRGKKISTLAYVLLKLGYPKDKLTGAITPKELMVKFHKFINKQDRIAKGCLLDWQGYSPAQKAVIFNKMSDFPKGSDGQHKHIVEYRKAGSPSEEIIARMKLKDWGAAEGSGASVKIVAAPAKVVVKQAAKPVDDEEEAAPVVAPAKGAIKPPVTGKKDNKPSQAELAALLDGDED